MQRYEAIENGIKNNDIKILREAIGSICYTSRDFSSGEFDEAIKYVESKGIKLKDESLIGEPTISSQKSIFSDDDFADAILELKLNFCDERIEDVKNIGKALYAKKSKVEDVDNFTEKLFSNEKIKKNQSHQKKNNTSLIIGLIAIIIIIIGVILAKK